MKSLLTRRFISWAKEKVYPVILIPVASLITTRIRTIRTILPTERITTIAPIRWIPTTKLTSKAVVAIAKTASKFQGGSLQCEPPFSLFTAYQFLRCSASVSSINLPPSLNAYTNIAFSARLMYSLQQSWNFSNISFCSSVKLFSKSSWCRAM